MMKHRRQVLIVGLGMVTVQGLPLEKFRQTVRVLPGEPPLAGQLAGEVNGQVPDGAYRHPALARQIVLQTVKPRLTLEHVLALPGAEILKLLSAIVAAHPETRRFAREMEG